MDKQSVGYTYNGILFSLNKEGNSDTCYNVDEPWRHYAQRNKPDTKGINAVWFPLHEVPRVVKFTGTESRMVDARGGGRGEWGAAVEWVQSFSFARWKVIWRWWWWLHNIVNVLNATELYTLKRLKWGFPGGTVVKNPPANSEDTGSSPGPGGSHMPRSNWACAPQLLSLRSRACESQLLSPCAATAEARAPQQGRLLQWEARAPQWGVAPAHATRESLRAAAKTHAAKNK